ALSSAKSCARCSSPPRSEPSSTSSSGDLPRRPLGQAKGFQLHAAVTSRAAGLLEPPEPDRKLKTCTQQVWDRLPKVLGRPSKVWDRPPKVLEPASDPSGGRPWNFRGSAGTLGARVQSSGGRARILGGRVQSSGGRARALRGRARSCRAGDRTLQG